MQDVFLFSDSIQRNISLDHPQVKPEQIRAAAEALGASGFINSLPGGFDFNVQERGSALSTGQRQIIAFLRAYAYDPPVLILDEATSSVDPETEELITKATLALTRKRTSLVIAHRLATIQNADRIIVLDKGRIVESGTHRELLERGGMYSELYRIQFEKHGNEAA
jgi:ABC-type multidrug transport system fused ATPase/permease subunit